MKNIVLCLFLVCSAHCLAQPTISALSSNSGNPGTTIEISGSNFNTTPADNFVFFGGTEATVVAASTTSLTVTVPIGATYLPVSVNNSATGLIGYSQYPFLPTYNNIAYASGLVNFDAGVNFASGQGICIATGDIDGDGKNDIIVSNYNVGTISVFRNTSTTGAITSSSFAPKFDLTIGPGIGTAPYIIAIGDIDGDGKPDIAVANGNNTVSVFRNVSSPGSLSVSSFSSRVDFTIGSGYENGIAIGDLDGDGKPDIVVTNNTSNSISVLHNIGSVGSITTGSFASKVDFVTGSTPYGIVIGDVDGDGKPDLIVTNGGSYTISVFRNICTVGAITSGSFDSRVDFPAGDGRFAVLSDVDGDGKCDIVAANENLGTISILRNTSSTGSINTASFAPKVDITTNSYPCSIATGDLDGDGRPDLVVSYDVDYNSSGKISVFRNSGVTGSISLSSFAPKTDVNAYGNGVAIADFDGDGKPDIATSPVYVLRNNPLGNISGTSSVCLGSTITLTDATAGGTWSSSNTTVGSISTAGVVTGISGGTTTISYTVTGGAASVVVTVNINPGAVTGITSVCPGYTITLTDGTLSGMWSSGAASIATVGSNGIVTGAAAGSVAISYILSSGCFAIAIVTVNSPSGTGGVISTIAGSGAAGLFTGGFSGDGGNATSARLNIPTHVMVDASGNLLISDNGNNRVRKVNTSGIITTIAGIGPGVYSGDGGPATAAGLYQPHCTAIDGAGNIYIADWGNHSIRKINTSGIINTIAGNGTQGYSGDGGAATSAQLDFPSSIAVDAFGNILIADGSNYRIRKVSTSGIITTVAGTGTQGYNGDGIAATTAQINSVFGIAVDGSGNLFIGDGGNHRVRKVDPAGVITTFAGNGVNGYTGDGTAATSCKVGGPDGIAIDGSGNVYIADESTQTIRKVNTSGIITTVAGNGTSGFTGDGSSATSATLDGPAGVSIDGTGNIFIADFANNRIRMVSFSSVTSILGNTPVCSGNSLTLSNSTSGGVWSSANSLVAAIGTTGIVSGLLPGTTTISYTVSGDCGMASATTIVTVNPLPNAGTITGTPVVCVGAVTHLTDATAGGVWSATYNASVDGSGNVTGITAGTATISYTVANSCGTVNAMSVVTVNPLPNAGTITGVLSVGVGTNSSLTDMAGGGIWIAGNSNATVSGGLVTGVSAGTVIISYAVTNSCGTAYATVIVTVTGTSCTPIISTFAGVNGTFGASGMGGPATAALLDQPSSVMADGSGNIYITEDHQVLKVNSSGIISKVAGNASNGFSGDGGAATAATLNLPHGVATDASGNVYFTDGNNNRIRKVSVSGVITTIAGTGVAGYGGDGTPATSAQIFNPWGIAIDGLGNIYFSDASNNRIRKVDPAGIITTVAGNGSAGYYGDGVAATSAELSAPIGLAINASGNIYFADNANSRIRMIAPSGIITTIAGNGTAGYSGDSGPATLAELYEPYGVSVDASGNVYVADATNNRIREINSSGAISTIAGNGVAGNTGDGGTPTLAELYNPFGVAVDGVGNVYIADYFNHCIRYITCTSSVSPIAGSTTICTGATSTLTDATPGGTWTSSNTSVVSIGSGTGNMTGVSAGTSTVTYNVSGSIAMVVITVDPLPDGGTITGIGSLCTGTTTNLTDAATGGVWTSSALGDATVNTSGVVTGIGAGTATISYRVTTGCGSAVATKVVTVNVTPAGTITGPSSVTVGANITLTDAIGSGTWSASNSNATVAGGVVNGVSAGTVTISYNVTGTCGPASATKLVTINPSGIGGITGSLSVCQGSTTALTDATPGGTWHSSNTLVATVGTSGIVSATATGSVSATAAISYTVGGVPTTVVVTVNPNPSGIIGPASFCSGSSITLSDLVAGGAWTNSGGVTLTPGSATTLTNVTATTAGTSTITYGLATGCYKTYNITVNNTPTAILGNTTVCQGSTTILSDAAGPTVSWTSSNTTVATINAAGACLGVNPGTSSITYTISTGCKTSTTVTVAAQPAAITNNSLICLPGAITLSDATTPGTWTSSNPARGSVDPTSGTVTGVSDGTATITYSTNGVGCYVLAVITVNSIASAGSLSGLGTVCAGATTTFSDAAAGGVWSSTNPATGTVSTSGSVHGLSVGTTTISYTVTNVCGSAAATAIVTVNPLPVAGTITGNAGAICAGSDLALTDIATSGVWTSSNTSIASVASDGTVTGVAGGMATISYTVTTGCGSVRTTTVVTVNAFTAGTIAGASSVIAGLNITLTDAVTGGVWSASNSNATVSSTGLVTGVTAGADVVSYTITNGCGSVTATYNITVTSSGISAITGIPSVCQGSTTALTDATPGGTWHSSNTLVATVGTSGIVTATATGSVSATATISYTVGGVPVSVVVTVNPNPSGIVGPTSVCAGATITLSDLVAGGTWINSGGVTLTPGSAATVTNVTSTMIGTYTITYALATGCAKTLNVTIKVLPTPILGNLSVCGVGSITILSDLTTTTSWASSAVGTATVNAAGVVYGVSPGTATIIFTAPNTCTTTAIVTVNALVTLPAISGATNVGHDLIITLSDGTTGGTWSSSNAALGSVDASGDVTGVGTSGTVTITYSVSYGSGCLATATKPITVPTPAPPAHGTTVGGTITMLAGTAVSLDDEAAGGIWSSSNTNIVTVDGGLLTAIAPGAANITHTITDSNGSISTSVTPVVVNSMLMDVRVVPNPNNGTFTVKGIMGTTQDVEVTLEVTDVLGQVIYSSKVTAADGKINEVVTLSNTLANGMYMMNVHTATDQKVFHFAVEK